MADFIERYVSQDELRRYGVSDLLQRASTASPWPLPESLVTTLMPLLVREGFDLDLDHPILVTEAPDRRGLILRQQIGAS